MELVYYIFCLLLSTSSGLNSSSKPETKCHSNLERILESNSPEVLAISVGNDLNTFTSSQVRLSVSWHHIDELFKHSSGLKSSFVSYFIEYSSLTTGSDGPDHVHHTPVLNSDITEHSILVDDDCKIYSISLGVVPLHNTTNTSLDESCANLLYSKAKMVWPSARHTVVSIFANRAEFLWPPGCNHQIVQNHWQMETCPVAQEHQKSSNCRTDSLRGSETGRYDVLNLEPCQEYQFRLRAPPLDGMMIRPGDALWAYETSTIPQPKIEALAGHDFLRLVIDQGSKCTPDAVIRNWRVTVCDSNEEYSNHSESCHNQLRQLTWLSRLKTRHRGFLEVRPLKACRLYTIALTPTDDQGDPIQPGEHYTSIHSTLCVPEEAEQDSSVSHTNTNNSELSVVLIIMILIGCAMVCLGLKSIVGINASLAKKYCSTNPNYESSADQHVLESITS